MSSGIFTPGPNRQITLGVQDAAPPTDLYISVDDQLITHIVNSAANVTVTITVRLLLPDTTIKINQFVYAPVSNRVGQQFVQNLSEGYILSVTATGGANNVGQTWVNCVLFRNVSFGTFPATNPYGEILLQGWLTGNNALSYPRGQLYTTQSLQGFIRSITGTAPAAGAEITETVPSGALWRLRMGFFSLTTSAAVATRFSHLIIDDGSNVIRNIPATNSQAASLTQGFNFATGQGNALFDGITGIQMPTESVLMLGGWRWRTLTTAIQAGDQYTAPQYEVEEWVVAG